jgi:hypothetical protein
MSRQVFARIAALFYVLNFVLGGLAFSRMAKGPTPASNAMIIAAAADYAIVVVLLGRVFEPAGKALSWAVAAVGLAGCVLSASEPLHLFVSPVNVLAVFGLYCLGLGLLILRSAMMPRWIGALLTLGGVSWLTFASPVLVHQLRPYNMAPGAIAELIFTLWLLVFGIRDQRARHA